MAWIAEDRRNTDIKTSATPLLTEAILQHLAQRYLPRYPTRRAVLMPALHYIQHLLGHIPQQAIAELAEFLQISPAEALDTASFYEEFWLKPKGKYLIAVCRSLTCELCGSNDLTASLKAKLGVEPGQTTRDGRYTLIEIECLGSCGTAPVALINQVLHESISPDQIGVAIDALPDDPAQYQDPAVNWLDPEDPLPAGQ